jgi:hypothetical protein
MTDMRIREYPMKLLALLNDLRQEPKPRTIVLMENLHPRWQQDLKMLRKKWRHIRVIRFV